MEGSVRKAQAGPVLKLKTPAQDERLERDRAIFEEWRALVGNEGQSRTEVVKYLLRKYELHAASSIYAILKRQGEKGGAV